MSEPKSNRTFLNLPNKRLGNAVPANRDRHLDNKPLDKKSHSCCAKFRGCGKCSTKCGGKTYTCRQHHPTIVCDTLEGLSLEQKVSQLRIVDVQGPVITYLFSGDVEPMNALLADIAAGKVGSLLNGFYATTIFSSAWDPVNGADIIFPTDVRTKPVLGYNYGKYFQDLALGSPTPIPLMDCLDAIHGAFTIFPIPLALAASFNTDVIEKAGRVTASECSASGVSWNLAPCCDVCWDARYGRIIESAGEDPYLGSEFVRAFIKGTQGNDLAASDTIMATIKHFGIEGQPEGGLNQRQPDASDTFKFNFRLPPFRAGIDAGVGSVMAGYSIYNSIPAVLNQELNIDVLRKRFGFDQLTISDLWNIGSSVNMGVSGNEKNATEMAIKAMIQGDLGGLSYGAYLKELVEEGRVPESLVDKACAQMLQSKYNLGLFTDPYKYTLNDEALIYTDENLAEARNAARETFVLLKNSIKNDSPVLPLSKTAKIALVGPLADDRTNMYGAWSIPISFFYPQNPYSIYEGIKEVVGDNVELASGYWVTRDMFVADRMVYTPPNDKSEQELLDEAVAVAAGKDVIVAVMGEINNMTGEFPILGPDGVVSCFTDISLFLTQKRLLETLRAAYPDTPIVMLLVTGRPKTIEEESISMDAILNVWQPGVEAGHAVADVLFGDYAPSGKLPANFPYRVGQIPASHYNYLPSANGIVEYIDLDSGVLPLYPFGYGLSYTSFSYSEIQLSSDKLKCSGSIIASIDITNTGDRQGKEVVQLYIHDQVASISRPVKELKRFQKISLEPGETKTIEFVITVEDLKFYNSELCYVAEPGAFTLYIGSSSANEDLKSTEFVLVK